MEEAENGTERGNVKAAQTNAEALPAKKAERTMLPFRMYVKDVRTLGSRFRVSDHWHKVIIRQLSMCVTEDKVRDMFVERGLEPVSIFKTYKKTWFMIVEFPDQAQCDRAIDWFDGFELCGSCIEVEPAIPYRKRQETKHALTVELSGLPENIHARDLYATIQEYGKLQSIKFAYTKERRRNVAMAVFSVTEDAKRAANNLDGKWFQGMQLHARLSPAVDEI